MMIGIQFGGMRPPRLAFGVYRDDAATLRSVSCRWSASSPPLGVTREFPGCVPLGVTRPPPDFRFGGAIGGTA